MWHLRIVHLFGSLALLLALLVAQQPAPAHAATPPPAPVRAGYIVHQVQRGETLSALAYRYGVTVQAIRDANGLRGSTIFAGQRLLIPAATAPAPAPTGVPAPAPVPDLSVVGTDVRYVIALTDVNVRNGPTQSFGIIGRLDRGQTVEVTGMSVDRGWWRIRCADGSVGNCWARASANLTQPTAGPGGATHIPVYATDVPLVMAVTTLEIRSGPASTFPVVGTLRTGETLRVTGVSADQGWWRVACLDGSIGNCWVSANLHLTMPVR